MVYLYLGDVDMSISFHPSIHPSINLSIYPSYYCSPSTCALAHAQVAQHVNHVYSHPHTAQTEHASYACRANVNKYNAQ
jgi:hypothetical protein